MLRRLEWWADRTLADGGALVEFSVFVPRRWAPVGELASVVEGAVRAVSRARTDRELKARWGPRLKRLGVFAYAVVLEVVYSPNAGWNVHGHGHAFVEPGKTGNTGLIEARLVEAVAAEIARAYDDEERLVDWRPVGEPDHGGRTAVISQIMDRGGRTRWEYFALRDPNHPGNIGSRFYGALDDVQLTTPWDTTPDAPAVDDDPFGDPFGVLTRNRAPTVQGPESWPPDPLWEAAVDHWWASATSAHQPARGFDLLGDIGGLLLADSPTAADLYREACLGLAGRPKFIVSKTLPARYPLPLELTAWSPPEVPDDALSILLGHDVTRALQSTRLGPLDIDPERVVHECLADGDFDAAKNLIESATNRGVFFRPEGDDLSIRFAPRSTP